MALNSTTLGTAITSALSTAFRAAWTTPALDDATAQAAKEASADEMAAIIGPAVATAVVAHFTSNAVVSLSGVLDGDSEALTGTGTLT